ncbi:MAG: mechanosensitive ion channel [Ectothiorhodospiraceae bacterium]
MTESAEGLRVEAGSQALLLVVDADAALEQVDRKTLAAVYAGRIGAAIASYRRERTTEYLLRAGFSAVAATLALAAFLWLGSRGLRRLDAALDTRLKVKLRGVEKQAFRVITASDMWRALHGARRLLWSLVIFVAVVLCLYFVLQQFPWTRLVAYRLIELLLNPVHTMGRQLLAVAPDLVFLALIFVVTRFALKTIRVFFAGMARGVITLGSFEQEWAWPTYRLLRVLVIIFALVLAYPYIPGSQTEAFKGISILLGIIVSIGSTSFISNVIAGYSLIYRRAFRIGDRVRIEGYVGDVVESRLLVTHLRTPKNEEVVIPNSLILTSNVVNYSATAREGRLILHTTVGIGYETPWRQVEAMLLQAASRTSGAVTEPRPFVLQQKLGDFCVVYELNVCCDNAHAMDRLYNHLHQNILDVFNEYGVQIMTPAYEADPEQPKIVPGDQWYAPPAKPSTPAE